MSDKLKSEMIAELSKIIDSIDDAFMNHTVAPHLVGYMISVKVQAALEIELWENALAK